MKTVKRLQNQTMSNASFSTVKEGSGVSVGFHHNYENSSIDQRHKELKVALQLDYSFTF